MDESHPEHERIPAPPASIPAPPVPIPAPPVAPAGSPQVPGQPPPGQGPIAQWTPPAAETKTSSTVAWVALAVAVIVLLSLIGLIFLGGRVSQILSSIGTSV
jgi:hypothetical protein